jgi:peptide/nickel transport system permease protein
LGSYIVRRLLQMLPLLLGITIVLFAVIHSVPGGPEGNLLSSGRFVDPQVIAAYRHRLGVDQPVPIQYLRFMEGLLRGDLGVSFSTTRPVAGLIAERLPATLALMASSFLLAAMVALPLGIWSALRKHGLFDMLGAGLSFLGIAMPAFWLGLLLQIVFALELRWLPVSGTHTVGVSSLSDRLVHLLLPTCVLSFRNVAGWSRYLRGSLISVLSTDYIRTAHAKGLSPRRVVLVHALRNALIPLVSVMALSLADLFSGAVVTETVFSWPGIGRLFVQAMYARDYPLLMGILLMGSFMVVVFNLVADVAYGVLDPRVRYE